MSNHQSCDNCAHRQGRRCIRTGWYCDIEMRHGGKCSKGGELLLWYPRPTLWARIFPTKESK